MLGLNIVHVDKTKYYHCQKCGYMSDRKYHAKMHFNRIHLQNGIPLTGKRKFNDHEAAKNKMIPQTQEITQVEKKDPTIDEVAKNDAIGILLKDGAKRKLKDETTTTPPSVSLDVNENQGMDMPHATQDTATVLQHMHVQNKFVFGESEMITSIGTSKVECGIQNGTMTMFYRSKKCKYPNVVNAKSIFECGRYLLSEDFEFNEI